MTQPCLGTEKLAPWAVVKIKLNRLTRDIRGVSTGNHSASVAHGKTFLKHIDLAA
jgi:hypothetical protein